MEEDVQEFLQEFKEITEGITRSLESFKHGISATTLISENQKKFNQKDNTAGWYKIRDTNTPEYGEIWVKDIGGRETIARCDGRAIIYPASSSMKKPEFWKPA